MISFNWRPLKVEKSWTHQKDQKSALIFAMEIISNISLELGSTYSCTYTSSTNKCWRIYCRVSGRLLMNNKKRNGDNVVCVVRASYGSCRYIKTFYGLRRCVENYRGVAILPTIAKVFEHIVCELSTVYIAISA